MRVAEGRKPLCLPLNNESHPTLALAASQTAQWRSMAAGQDILVVDPSDPGYSAKGTYYMSVTRYYMSVTRTTAHVGRSAFVTALPSVSCWGNSCLFFRL